MPAPQIHPALDHVDRIHPSRERREKQLEREQPGITHLEFLAQLQSFRLQGKILLPVRQDIDPGIHPGPATGKLLDIGINNSSRVIQNNTGNLK